MPEKYLRVTMPDGCKWDVPAKVIAEDRAKYYAAADPDTTYEEEFEFTMGNDFELKDWSGNNMNWDEVKDYAEKAILPDPVIDWEEGWVDGEKEVIEK
ncbi:hypothetical protein Desde_1055 [Desulfitobacterium dehalogenans ATCC 51507]|uniref:Uncharacterized protein n=1 Tax=Desulfitobacterium dehalogenans (strain ATCC 51507 / DSM 9161 / JW/IU-DC1) TaxID=756499 RepID=I4A6A3_DESDJ|nr:hypothetical protein [Desulfitobacterium dehalogenans]AFL99487.1 hypothetical protein Desde_1055 [Desulfitobacterium dehalogenans ATCC 51507]